MTIFGMAWAPMQVKTCNVGVFFGCAVFYLLMDSISPRAESPRGTSEVSQMDVGQQAASKTVLAYSTVDKVRPMLATTMCS